MANPGAGEIRPFLFTGVKNPHKPRTAMERYCKKVETNYLRAVLDPDSRSHHISALKAHWEWAYDVTMMERHNNDEILAAMLIGCMISGTVPETR